MQSVGRVLALICMLLIAAGGWAADLIQSVPAQSPAYRQARLLAERGLLTGETDALRSTPPRTLTRYDFAYLLIEPLERLTALVDAQESPSIAPEQLRRTELAYEVVSKVSATELDQLLQATQQLLATFGHEIDELRPGLTRQASIAAWKLGQPKFRPWIKAPAAGATGESTWRISVNPKATPNTIGNPLPYPLRGGANPLGPDVLMRSGEEPGENPTTSVIGVRPISTLEAAVDVAFGRLRLYTVVSSLPGQDPVELLKPDATGRAMLGFRYDLVRVNDLGISGIFEYHILRSNEPGNMNTNTGAVGGIGLTW